MKMQFTLNDETIDLVVAQLRTVLEAPYFMYNGNKYAGGKVIVHSLKNASMFMHGKKRPMIHFTFNGSYKDYFCEGDIITSYDADKVVVKGETEKTFTKATATAKEAEKIAATARMNKEYEEEYERAYWADVEAEMDSWMNDEFDDEY